MHQPSVKSVYKTNHKSKHKAYIHKHQTHFFEKLVPSALPLLKEDVRLGHAGIINHSISFIDTRLKKNQRAGQ